MCPRNALVFLIAASLLAACGGGGDSAMMPISFTSFSAVKSNQPVQASGVSQTVSATTLGGSVQSTTVDAVDKANSSAQITYGAIPAMSAFSFTTPTSSVSFRG